MAGRSTIPAWLEKHVVKGTRAELVHARQTSKGASGFSKILQKLRLRPKTAGQPFLFVYSTKMLELPMNFVDCIGRTMILPREAPASWNSLAADRFDANLLWQKARKLINDAFQGYDGLEDAIENMRYDLLNDAGEIILPMAWSRAVKPGMVITRALWPKAPSLDSKGAERLQRRYIVGHIEDRDVHDVEEVEQE